jgi:hypothetical protein
VAFAPKAMAKKLARTKHSSTPAKQSIHFKCAVLPKSAERQHQLVAPKLRQREKSNNSEPLFMPDKNYRQSNHNRITHTLLNLTKSTWDYSLGKLFYTNLTSVCNDVHHHDQPDWKKTLPTRSDLISEGFGQPDLNHSFSQEACFETTVLHTLCSGFLNPTDTLAVMEAHPLIGHLASSKVAYTNYDFRWLRQYKIDWDTQNTIYEAHQAAMTACLIHFHLDTSLLL